MPFRNAIPPFTFIEKKSRTAAYDITVKKLERWLFRVLFFFVVNNSIYGSLLHIWRKTWKQIFKNAQDFKKLITKMLEVTVHNFSTFWALFWAL
jgi:hypothetical protein